MDRKTSPKPLNDQAVRQMGNALKSRYEEARRLLRDATHTEAAARYRVGRIVQEIRQDAHRYGEAAVPTLAAALGLDETTLYRYARIADCWTEPEFIEVIGNRMPNGSPLSWSHLLEISAVSRSEERERLVIEATTNGLSVRDLVALIRNQEQSPPSGRSASISDRLRWFIDFTAALERGVKATEKALHRLEATPETIRVLNDARAARDRIHDILEHYGAVLDAAEDRIQAEPEEHDEEVIDSKPPTKRKGMLLYGMEPPKPKGKP